MSTTSHADAPPSVLHIEGEMTIYRAEELKQAVLAALAAAPVLEIDLAGVTKFDSAGLQLLMLAKQTARAGGRALRLARPSQAVREVFSLLQIGAWFDEPRAIAPHASAAAQRSSQPFAAGASDES